MLVEMMCHYCRNKLPKSEFKIKGFGSHSNYCNSCRELAVSKERDRNVDNHSRDYNDLEKNLANKYIKSLSKDEVKKKLHLSNGALVC